MPDSKNWIVASIYYTDELKTLLSGFITPLLMDLTVQNFNYRKIISSGNDKGPHYRIALMLDTPVAEQYILEFHRRVTGFLSQKKTSITLPVNDGNRLFMHYPDNSVHYNQYSPYPISTRIAEAQLINYMDSITQAFLLISSEEEIDEDLIISITARFILINFAVLNEEEEKLLPHFRRTLDKTIGSNGRQSSFAAGIISEISQQEDLIREMVQEVFLDSRNNNNHWLSDLRSKTAEIRSSGDGDRDELLNELNHIILRQFSLSAEDMIMVIIIVEYCIKEYDKSSVL